MSEAVEVTSGDELVASHKRLMALEEELDKQRKAHYQMIGKFLASKGIKKATDEHRRFVAGPYLITVRPNWSSWNNAVIIEAVERA